MLLIWRPGLRGPEATKMPELRTVGGKPALVLAVHHLQPHETDLPIAALERLYPAPRIREEP